MLNQVLLDQMRENLLLQRVPSFQNDEMLKKSHWHLDGFIGILHVIDQAIDVLPVGTFLVEETFERSVLIYHVD
jgi:hypothetical protein